jgi:hypothetical protein
MQRASWMAAGAVVFAWLAGCKATIPEGVYACTRPSDCPSGFECRADDSGALYCFRPGGASAGSGDLGGQGGRGGRGGAGGGAGSDAGGAAGAGRGGAPGDAGPPVGGADAGPPQPVAPSTTGFSTLGGVRSGGGLRLYDERFEGGERRCTSDERMCVTGGFEP